MTTMVSKDDIEDALFRAGARAAELPKLLKVIDAYAINLGRQMTPVDWHPEPYKYLRPGETDVEAGKRRCRRCGKVKDLNVRNFAPSARDPQRRRLSCVDCSPNRRLVQLFSCRGCSERLPVEKFPAAKLKNPRASYKCLVCEPK
jgi:hypothetical protein